MSLSAPRTLSGGLRPRRISKGQRTSQRRTAGRHVQGRRRLAIEALEDRRLLANWSGDIPDGTVWGSAEVQRITGSVRVPAGAELTIQPGAIIKFNSSYNLIVDGSVDARGTPQQPIYFTSYRDDTIGGDTNGDGASTTASKGDWGRIEFASSSTGSTLAHVEISYGGGTGANGALTVDGGLTLTNSVIRDSLRRGVQLVTSAPTLTDVTFRNNGWAAIRADLASQPRIENAVFDKNATNGMELDSGSLPGHTVWDNPAVPYVLTGNLTVPSGTSLTVAPGQIVAANSYSLTVNGTLTARGTATQPIVFTSTYDNSLGVDIDNNQATTPARGNWPGLRLQSGSVANVLEHVEIRYAGTSTRTGAAVVAAGPLELRDSIIRDSYEGLRIAASTPVVTGTTFRNSYRAAITMDLGSDPAITDVVLENNGVNGLQLDSGNLVQSSRWDDPDVPYVLSGHVTVPAGMSLSVGAGQVVGSSTYALTVAGNLTALGTVAQPIIFTSTADNSIAVDIDNNPASTPARGNWPGIRLQNTSIDNVLEHVEIRYSGTSTPAAALITAGPLTMRDSLIRDSYQGVRIEASTPLLSGVSILNSNGAALSADLASHPQITNLTLTNNGRNALVLDGGTLPGNATWDQSAVVYWLASKVTVPTGATLLVTPGQIIALDGYAYGGELLVEGTLDAQGTADRPIIFTAPADNSLPVNIDNASYTPGRGYWRQIQFASTSTGNILDHCELRYGGGATPGTVFANGGPLTIRNSLIRDNAFSALVVGNSSTVDAANNLMVRSSQEAVLVSGGATLQAFNNTIDNNTGGVTVDGATAILSNNLITNNLKQGIKAVNGATVAARFNDVFQNSGGNYSGLADLTGTAGNISADPLYFSRPNDQYQLRARSPAVDAGTSDGAPATDSWGNSRFDDPHAPNRGAGAQPYVDLGAFERQETAGPSDVDLEAIAVNGPAAGTQGQQVTITWNVRNAGTGLAVGSWHDAVYLSMDAVWTPDDIRLGEVLHQGDLGPGQVYPGLVTVALPGVSPAAYHFLVRTNSRNEVYEATALLNNVGVSANTAALDVPTLTLGVPATGQLVAVGDAKLYKVTVPAGASLAVTLTGSTGSVNELFLKYGQAPSRQSFDQRSVRPASPEQAVFAGSTLAGTYYLLVYGAQIPQAETFTLTASQQGFSVAQVTPDRGSNQGRVTVSLAGAQFDPAATVRLIDSTGGPLEASAVYFTDSGLISATFELTGRPKGLADIQVVNPGNVAATLDDAFTINDAQPGRLVTHVVAPSRVRLGRGFQAVVEYSNDGQTDLLAPIMRLDGKGFNELSLYPDFRQVGTNLDLIGVNPNGPAGVLPPGARGHIVVYGRTLTEGDDQLDLTIGDYPDVPIDWNALKQVIRPEGISAADWDAMYPHLQANVGATWSQYHATISRDVTLLPPALGLNYRLQDVFQLELERAFAAVHTHLLGKLSWATTRQPLAGVAIELDDDAAGNFAFGVSLNDGSFLVSSIEPGTYDVAFNGFLPAGTSQLIVGNTSLENVNLSAMPAARISGSVLLDATGVPRRNELVTATSRDRTLFTWTDMEGQFLFDTLAADTYDLTVGGETLAPRELRGLAIAAGNEWHSATLLVQPAGMMSGKVTGPGGPIAGAMVSATNADGIGSIAETDSAGVFRINGLSAGVYNVLASAPGLIAGQLSDLQVAAGTTLANVDLALTQGGSATGAVILSGNGSPAAAVILELESDRHRVACQADGQGIFRIDGLPPGTYTVTTRGDAFKSVSTLATVLAGAETTVDLFTTPLATVHGTVTNATTGRPLEKVVVHALDKSGLAITAALTDPAGAYRLEGLDVGTYQIVVGDLATVGIARHSVAVDLSTTSVTVDFFPDVAGILTGTAFESDTITPVADAVVALVREGQVALQMSTNAQGQFAFVVVAAGTYQLEAAAPGRDFAPLPNIVIGGGASSSEHQLVAGSETLAGTVRDAATGQPLAGAAIAIQRPGAALATAPGLVTSADGSFLFYGLRPGEFEVRAAANGYALASQTVLVTSGPSTHVDFQLVVGLTLRGIVSDARTDQPLAEALVSVASATAKGFNAKLLTDEFGTYQFADLPAGKYDLTVQAAGLETFVLHDVSVNQPEQSQPVALEMATTNVSGTVHDAFGPVAGAKVVATDQHGSVIELAVTTADGSYRLDSLPTGSFSLVAIAAAAQGSEPKPIVLTAGQTIVDIDLAITAIGTSDTELPWLRDRYFSAGEDWVQHLQSDPTGNRWNKGPYKARVTQLGHLCQLNDNDKKSLSKVKDFLDGTGGESEEGLFRDWQRARQAAILVDTIAGPAVIRNLITQTRQFVGAFVPLLSTLARLGLYMKSPDLTRLEAELETADYPAAHSSAEQVISYLKEPLARQLDTVESLIRKGVLLNGWAKGEIEGVLEQLTQVRRAKDQFLTNLRLAELHLLLHAKALQAEIDYYFQGKPTYEKIVAMISEARSSTISREHWVDSRLSKLKVFLCKSGKCPSTVCCPGLHSSPSPNGEAESGTCSDGGSCAPQLSADGCGGCPQTDNPPGRPPASPGDPSGSSPGGTGGGGSPVSVVVPRDPNDKVGPAAFGADGFLQPGIMLYDIHFENDPNAGAKIPAQEVFVTDTLSPNLDLATFEFVSFGFQNFEFDVPAGLSHYEKTLDLRPDGINLLVPVVLDVNLQTRVLSVTFRSLDPLTKLLPDDVDAGFLPVNDKQLHNGEGYFTYQVRPQSGLPSGTVITNRADIKFDVNAIIPTPETKHTLDIGPPISQVTALPAAVPTSFSVSWQGSDDPAGSGIAGFDVFVSTDGGPFTTWQTATTAMSAVFVGQIGHSYRFYSMATDNVGHREAVPESPDAYTAVSGNLWHNAANRFDVSGSTDVTAQDVLLIINYINNHPGDQSLPAPPATPPPYYDVTDDGLCTANDALFVINEINRRLSPTGAGEADGEEPAAAAVFVAVALPRAARGDYPSEPQPTAASAACLALRPTRGESATWTGRRDREAAPLPVLAAGRDDGLAGTPAVLVARRVWTRQTLEELDIAFSRWDDLLPPRVVDLVVA